MVTEAPTVGPQETHFDPEYGHLPSPGEPSAKLVENAHQYFVIGNTSTILRNPETGEVYLLSQNMDSGEDNPQLVGGVTNADETGPQSIARHLLDDTNLVIDPERFTAVSYFDTSNDASDSSLPMGRAKNTAYVVDLTREEIAGLNQTVAKVASNDKQNHGRWYNPETDFSAFPDKVKSALRDYFTHQVSQEATMNALREMAEQDDRGASSVIENKTYSMHETYFLPKNNKPLPVPADVLRAPLEIYGKAHEQYVIGYNDVILRNPKTGEMYLPTRDIEPEKGKPWFIGGRTNPDETGPQSISRHVLHDTQLTIDPDRFNAVSYFDISHLTPNNVPAMRHAKNTVYVVDLTEAEIAALDHTNSQAGLSNEYSHGRWYHPALDHEDFPDPVKVAVRDYFTYQVSHVATMNALRKMAEQEGDERALIAS